MIIRSLRLRHGRFALPKPPTPKRPWHRFVSTERQEHQLTPNPFEDGGNNAAALNAVEESDQVKRDWEFFQFQKAATNQMGTQMTPHYKPRDLIANPPSPSDITLELLMASQTHLGHHTSLWHPGNARYIFGIRGSDDPIHIISLDVTASHLRRACKIVQGVTERGGLVLFVGSRTGQARAVVKAAEMAQGCHLFGRWVPGSITNGQQILGRCAKKVVDEMDKEVPGFEEQLHLAAAIKPDLVVCLNPLENYVLLHECGLNSIPTIGIVDTDCNPAWVTYPIPANDDSLRSVFVVAGALGRAGQQGQEIRLENAKNGQVDYRFEHGLTEPTQEERAAYEARQAHSNAQAHRYDEFEDADEGGPDEVVGEGMSALEEGAQSDADGVDQSLVTEQKLESWKEETATSLGWGGASERRPDSKEWQEGKGVKHSDLAKAARKAEAAEQQRIERRTLKESGLNVENEATPPSEQQAQSMPNTEQAATQNSRQQPALNASHDFVTRHPSADPPTEVHDQTQRNEREMQLLEEVKQAAAQELHAHTTVAGSGSDISSQASISQEQEQDRQLPPSSSQPIEQSSAPDSQPNQPQFSREQQLLQREQEMKQRWEEMERREQALAKTSTAEILSQTESAGEAATKSSSETVDQGRKPEGRKD